MDDWIRFQRQLAKDLKKEASFLTGNPSRELSRYARAYQRDFRNLRMSSEDSLISSLNEHSLVLVGDFHTLRQSQRTLIRWLRDERITPPNVIALEVMTPATQALWKRLRESGKENWEEVMREALLLERNWGASWEPYRDLFSLCWKKKIELISLGPQRGSLKTRDQKASEILLKSHQRTWALMGEYHLAQSFLPSLLKPKKPLVIQQNEDRLSMNFLAKRQMMILEKPHRNFFCILHTPPWLKWQSFVHRHLHPFEELAPEGSPHDQVTWCLKTLTDFLKDPRFPQPEAEFRDFDVLVPEDPRFSKLVRSLKPQARSYVLRMLQATHLAVLEKKNILLVSENTWNTCAHGAATILYRTWSQQKQIPQGFFQLCLQEALCFFLSKILNHSRRARLWTEAPTHFSRATLKHLRRFPFRFERLRQKALRHPSEATFLGHRIADRLFEAFLTTEFSKLRLLRLISRPVESEEEAFEKLVELHSVSFAYESR